MTSSGTAAAGTTPTRLFSVGGGTTDLSLWWIDLRDVSGPVRVALFAATGVALPAWALRRAPGPRLRAVAAGSQPETSGREGLADLAAAYALLESASSGRTVCVDDVASGRLRSFQQPLDEKFGLLND